MSRFQFLAVLLAAALMGPAANSMGAGECCSHCGCHSHLKKVCRLVCDTKKVTDVDYAVKCEDICLHGRSKKCGCECIPTCHKIKTVKKLLKIETTREVPVYKCVVEAICGNCCDRLAAQGQPVQANVVAAGRLETGSRR